MKKQKGVYELFFKRFLDIILSLLGIIVLSPVILIVAILVRINLGSPVLFTQDRPGKDGRIFKLYKFRSMKDLIDKNGNELDDEVRLTPFGKKLRSTSLDELPELFNILKGDMSIVGPRPLLVEYLPYYTKEEMRRHSVRPGLTGLAQINGRNSISWEDTFDWDVKYVDNITFIGDVKIVWKTIDKVIRKADIQMGDTRTVGRLDDERRK